MPVDPFDELLILQRYTMQKIIITDLTRISNKQIACTAGIDLTTGQCVRPMPYLTIVECKRLNILPGTILKGEFTPALNLKGPHQEDMTYKMLSSMGACNSSDFKLALHAGLYDSLEKGFQIELANNQKYLPVSHSVGRSIMTLKIRPDKVEVVEGAYCPNTIKLNFMDSSGRAYKYMAITDFGFHGFTESLHTLNVLKTLNDFIGSQAEVYLRIGLSRPWDNGKVNGYWMQVNGLYTFPDYYHEIRCYH